MNRLKQVLATAASTAMALASVALPAHAVVGYTLDGEASLVSGGNPGNAIQLVSDGSPGYGAIDFDVATGTTWSGLATLSADYNVTDDNCMGGSPRFSIGVDTNGDGVADGHVHVSFGPSPTFTGCASGWQSTGNLIGNNDAGRFDFSQFGGSPFTTYSNAPANVLAGTVTEILLPVDAGWAFVDGEQTVLVDNVAINNDLYNFEPLATKESCKKGGWRDFTQPGPFKNQGDCVSYFATGGKNLPSQ